jgi:hypothetical protein
MSYFEWLKDIFGFIRLRNQVQENSKILNELNWANIFNNSINSSQWCINKNFSPGRFAIGYPLLYALFKILDEIKPKRILEFGLGESTKLFHQYAIYFSDVQVTTLEHDLDWVKFYLNKKQIPDNSAIKIVENKEIIYNGNVTLGIENLNQIIQESLYDLILVDAPFGSKRFSRSQILSLIPINIDQNHFIIIIDDYNREGEKETCIELEKIFVKNNIEFFKGVYSGAKESIIYCSRDLKFLTTL